MKTRKIQRAKLELSEIGFGCMSLGSDYTLNERMIHKAIDHGISYFDTADLYQRGENERMLGKAIKGKREDLIIATKVGNRWFDDKEGWEWTPRKNYILNAVDDCLLRLGIDQIDICQLHGGTIEDPLEEIIEAFEELQELGKIRHYGLSSIRPNVFMKMAKESRVVSNMMQYSLLDRRAEPYLEQLNDLGVGVITRGGLAKGLLAGKRISDYLGYTIQSIDLMIDKMKLFSIEKKYLSHVALDWILGHSAVTSVVVGLSNMDQLNELIAFEASTPLSTIERDELSHVLKPAVYDKHLV